MPRHFAFALGALGTVLAALASSAAVGCTSSHVTLGSQGSLCDFDEQCDPAQGLTCECVVTKSPDDEGSDQIVYHGHCDKKGTVCPNRDAGPDAEDASDASDAAAKSDAADAKSDAADAADAMAADADAADAG